MTDKKYQCNKHEVNPIINICFNCINAKTNRHNRMLEFMNFILKEDWNNQYFIKNKTKKLLQEIGELK